MANKTNTDRDIANGMNLFRRYYDPYISHLKAGDLHAAGETSSEAASCFTFAKMDLNDLIRACNYVSKIWQLADIPDIIMIRSSVKSIIDSKMDVINSSPDLFDRLSYITHSLFDLDTFKISYKERIISDTSDLLSILPSTIDNLEGIKAASSIVADVHIKDLSPKDYPYLTPADICVPS